MHPFRFGVVAGHAADAKAWLGTARRVEELGYATLLVPDTLWTTSPFLASSAAAAVTSELRLGTHVLAAPFRTPATVARETAALDLLADRRFELGLGVGRPGARAETEQLGMEWGTSAHRLDLLAETIRAVRQRFEEVQRPAPRILLAGAGPKLTELAAADADILTLALRHETDEEALASHVGRLQGIAGGALDRLELAVHISVVGDEVPEFLVRSGTDVAALRASGSYSVLEGTPRQMAEVLRRRRDRLGISYVTVGQQALEQFAPVVELLAGE